MKSIWLHLRCMGQLFALVVFFAGVQNASAALKGCEGTVYLKLPDGWTTAFTAGGGNFNAFTKSTTYPSWYEISTAQIGGTNMPGVFHISVARGDYGQAGGITRTQIGKNVQFQETNGFSCKDFGAANELWIQPSFEDPTKPYVKGDPPDVKYFYVFLPDNKIWKSAVPMISEDGKDREMDIDNNNCGWYFRRYVDEPLPTKVFIHRDDDENLSNAIGFGGEKAANEGKAPDEINLKMMFDFYDQELGLEKKLYFVADEKKASEHQGVDFGWYLTPPAITGSCMYFLAARIYDTDADLHPSFSCYKKDSRDNEEGCQGVDKRTAAQGVDLNTALAAIKACIGVTPGIVESTLDKATKKPKLTTVGKKCFIDENYFNQLFNYTQDVNEVTCYDMPFTRADDGKWEFDSDFYTSGGLARAAQGGFYPAESTTVERLMDADSNQVAVPTARTKRWAQGPVFYAPALRELHPTEKSPLIDTYCNGPGWSGGYNCNGLFADADADVTTAAVGAALHLVAPNDCVFGWSCPDKAPADWQFYASGTDSAVAATATGADYRWNSDVGSKNGGRNQHFCFESHAKFTYRRGLRFSVRGDDDIWVFIDNKLAVDIGGTHFPAPGYVDLDKFMPNAKTDSTYDIDIFFCDRRTTMSNIRINTNMFIEQNVGIELVRMQDDSYIDNGDRCFKICYNAPFDAGCRRASPKRELCGPEILNEKKTVKYLFTQDSTGVDSKKTLISEEQFDSNPIQMEGAINVSNPVFPIINERVLKPQLDAGEYYLVIKIDEERTVIPFSVVADTVEEPDEIEDTLQLVFVDSDSTDKIVWQDKDYDDNRLKGAAYDFYLLLLDSDGKPCTKCNDFKLELDSSTSPGLEIVAGGEFTNGRAKITVRSSKVYEKCSNKKACSGAAELVVRINEPLLTASYGNIRFVEPSVPVPQVVEIFDVKGAPMEKIYVPFKYFSESVNYQDGKADSLSIRFDKPLSEDVLPKYLCLKFDEDNLTKINPYKLGLSSVAADTAFFCSSQFDSVQIHKAFSESPDHGRTLLFVSDSSFSADVKTTVEAEDKLISFIGNKLGGKPSYFEQKLNDRMAPLILSASVKEKEECNILTVKASEKVRVKKNFAQESFTFYLNSSEEEKFVSLKQESPVSATDTNVMNVTYCGNDKPWNGDYIRFRADENIWSDVFAESDSSGLFWNYPTNYGPAKRTPSPWVYVTGKEKTGEDVEIDSKPKFTIRMIGPFQFAIVMVVQGHFLENSYWVFDLQGNVLRQGVILSNETIVPALSSGSYIVKVGMGFRRVNIQ